jgi:hypothetical protein
LACGSRLPANLLCNRIVLEEAGPHSTSRSSLSMPQFSLGSKKARFSPRHSGAAAAEFLSVLAFSLDQLCLDLLAPFQSHSSSSSCSCSRIKGRRERKSCVARFFSPLFFSLFFATLLRQGVSPRPPSGSPPPAKILTPARLRQSSSVWSKERRRFVDFLFGIVWLVMGGGENDN